VVIALGFALLAVVAVQVATARAAVMPETASPAAARESTPLCSPECEVIIAPTEAASGLEYEGGGPGGGFTPQELREAYGLPEHGGRNATIAVVDERGDAEAEADLAFYREHFGLPECTAASGCFRQLNEFGAPRDPTASGSWAGEISLDLDMVTSACPECRIDLYEAAGTVGLREAIDTAVEEGATAVTNSWNLGFEEGNPANAAACEIELCVSQAEEEVVDRSLDHPGVPILFSGGDYGYGVRFPADSPYVISVGGTRLLHDPETSRGWSEEVWSNTAYGRNRKGRGTGSGCSIFEEEPSWQTDTACTDLGGWTVGGGTSAAAPFVAGVEGLSSGRARELGAQAFWEAGEAGSLFDVTTGDDGECAPPAEDAYWCTAGAGFDGPTGWGTPDGPLAFETPPAATTVGAEDETQTSATLQGLVDNRGNPTPSSCAIQIARQGTDFSPVLASFPCEPGSITGDGSESVTAAVTGLSPHTAYAFRVEATNSAAGPVFSSGYSFLTLPDPPAVETIGASPLGQTDATITGRVDNEGAFDGSICSFRVVEADDPSFAAPYTEVPCSPGKVEEEGMRFVSADLSGLAVNTPYLYRLEATNEGGGPTISAATPFRTLPNQPVVKVGGAEAATATTAVLGGQVDNEGSPDGSTCSLEVAHPGSPGLAVPFLSVPCDPALVSGEGDVAVTGSVTGLSPATGYMFRVSAENAGGGPSLSPWTSFTTAAAPVLTPEGGTWTGPGIVIAGPPDEIEMANPERTGATVVAPGPVTAQPSPPDNVIKVGAARVRGGFVLLTVTVPGPGTVNVGGGAIRPAADRSIASGSLTLRAALTRPTLRRASHRKLHLSLRVTFTPAGGTPATKSVSVVVGRSPSGR
jgi:hypothetical protein